MLIAIGALVLMVLSLGGIAVTPGAYIFDVSEESRLIVVFGVLGLAGFVLGVVTGFIAPAREPKIEANSS